MDGFYTAKEAAEKLGLNYHTFMARTKKRGMYPFQRAGWVLLFSKQDIDQHANDNALAGTTGSVLLHGNEEPDREMEGSSDQTRHDGSGRPKDT